jgi:hypothetical protein
LRPCHPLDEARLVGPHRAALDREETIDASGIHLFANWPALPPALYDEARSIARSAGWKPRLWGAGAFLHRAPPCNPR